MATKIQFRRGTAAQWSSANPVLADGELGLETDTDQMKIGNGVQAWNARPYANVGPAGPQGATGSQGPQGATGPQGPAGDPVSLLAAWPIGSVYTSVLPANPSTLFGGTWVAIAAGRTLVGIDAGDPDFDTAEEMGGAKTVTLTEAQIPSHTHVQNAHNHVQDAHTHTQNSHNHTQDAHSHTIPVGATDDTAAPFDRADAGTNASGANATTATGTTTATNQAATATNQNATATNQAAAATNQSTGGSAAHNNLPPYFVVYAWKRTA